MTLIVDHKEKYDKSPHLQASTWKHFALCAILEKFLFFHSNTMLSVIIKLWETGVWNPEL